MPALTGTLQSEKQGSKGFYVMLSPDRVTQAARETGSRDRILALVRTGRQHLSPARLGEQAFEARYPAWSPFTAGSQSPVVSDPYRS